MLRKLNSVAQAKPDSRQLTGREERPVGALAFTRSPRESERLLPNAGRNPAMIQNVQPQPMRVSPSIKTIKMSAPSVGSIVTVFRQTDTRKELP